jgi:3-oxoacyl-(acyl-carrier-protein) synthase
MLGHGMGASSALEAIICVEALRHQHVPPTINCEHPDPAAEGLDLVRGEGRPHRMRHTLSNSFGFGGANSVLIVSELS